MKFILMLIASILLAGTALSKQEVKIYTYDVLPPFAFKDDSGKLTGIYVEMTRRAIERMPDYSVEFEVVPWSRAKSMVKKGSAFAILPPYFHAHDWLTDDTKLPYIWPYSLELHYQTDVVICSEAVSKIPRPNFPADYEGLRFVMFRGDGRAGQEFQNMVDSGEIRLQSVKDIAATVAVIQKNRADCTAASKLPFAWNIKNLKKSGKYAAIDKGVKLVETAIINQNSGYLGYTDVDDEKNFPFKKDFTIKFDIEILKMKKSGEVEKLINEFTSF